MSDVPTCLSETGKWHLKVLLHLTLKTLLWELDAYPKSILYIGKRWFRLQHSWILCSWKTEIHGQRIRLDSVWEIITLLPSHLLAFITLLTAHCAVMAHEIDPFWCLPPDFALGSSSRWGHLRVQHGDVNAACGHTLFQLCVLKCHWCVNPPVLNVPG